MLKIKPATLTKAVCLTLLSSAIMANQTPDADDLVGHKYLGVHGISISADNDRIYNSDPNATLDSASGFGFEFGYRVSPLFETRLSLTRLNVDTERKGYDIPTGSSLGLDLLYFPQKSNFYTIVGANFLDIDHSNLSGDLGAGYRHFISDNSALYIEGKGHYQFDDNHKDFSSRIGFVYYFDKKTAPVKRSATTVKPTKAASVALADDDKDGVSNTYDQCPGSHQEYKVDKSGCTLYIERERTIELHIPFDNDKSDIKAEGKKDIASVAQFLKEYEQASITIHGHTSSQGNAAYNQKLSEKRAQAVIDMLINSFSIDQSRLKAIGHGENQLKNTSNTEAAHAQNRRIEATVTAEKRIPVKR